MVAVATTVLRGVGSRSSVNEPAAARTNTSGSASPEPTITGIARIPTTGTTVNAGRRSPRAMLSVVTATVTPSSASTKTIPASASAGTR